MIVVAIRELQLLITFSISKNHVCMKGVKKNTDAKTLYFLMGKYVAA